MKTEPSQMHTMQLTRSPEQTGKKYPPQRSQRQKCRRSFFCFYGYKSWRHLTITKSEMAPFSCFTASDLFCKIHKSIIIRSTKQTTTRQTTSRVIKEKQPFKSKNKMMCEDPSETLPTPAGFYLRIQRLIKMILRKAAHTCWKC